jgi:putative inorganic carbon (HCO3(-)) transporter
MRDYILTAFIFAIIPVCFFRPWIGIIAWYWFGLMNPHRHTWNFAFTLPFAMLIAIATMAGMLFARDRRPIPWNRELVIMVVLVLYFTITSYFAWVPEVAWPQWEKVFKVVLMTLVATMFIYGRDRIRVLMLTVVFSIGFYGVKAFFWVLRSGGSEHVQGPDNTFMDGNTFIGLAFNMVLPLMIFMAREETKPWLRRTLYFMAACTVVSTIFTYSRGAYVGLAIIIPLIFLRSRQKVLAACILVPALLLAPFVLPDKVGKRADLIENYQEDRSANQRLQSWTVAWNLASDRPFTGAGFEFEYGDPVRWFSYASEKYMWAISRTSAAHSIYFQVLGQHGFLATGLFFALLFGTLLSLARTKKHALRSPHTSWMATYANGMQVAMVGYMVSGAFLSAAYFDLAWLFFAISAILAHELRNVAKSPSNVSAGGVLPSSQPAVALMRASAIHGRGNWQ